MTTIIWLLVLFSSAAYGASIEQKDVSGYILDDDVVPKHYEIELKPYLNERNGADKLFKFDGTVAITIRTDKDNVPHIVLHSRGLTIIGAELVKESDRGNKLKIGVSEADSLTDKVVITLEEGLIKNTDYVLSFVFSGKLNQKDSKGFYVSSYLNDRSEQVHFAATKLKPVHARAVFPCFDEPRFKATFTLKINREKEWTSAANTKIQSKVQLDNEQRTIDIYKRSPVMSTYLVGLIISDFQPRVSEARDIRILIRPNKLENTKCAADIVPRILEKVERFTGIPYNSIDGVEKLDIVGLQSIPVGLENWGLININEKYLLSEGVEFTEKEKEDMYGVVGEQLSHQWFGNLVTAKWWNDIWLHAGFGNFLGQYLLKKELLGEQLREHKYVTEHLRPVLFLDRQSSSYPISGKKVETLSDIREMFSALSYCKGGSILRMVSKLMGKDAFQRGIQNYLRENSHKAVKPGKLFDALKTQYQNDQVDLKELLTDFTKKSGYPLVTVKLSEDGESITVSQKRYGKESGQESDQWIIPFTYTTNVENDFTTLTPRVFLKKNEEKIIRLGHKADWVIGNIQQIGYYRVNYNEKNWLKLQEAVSAPDDSGIHRINRDQLRDDSLDFFATGEVDISLMTKLHGLDLGRTYGGHEHLSDTDDLIEQPEDIQTSSDVPEKIEEFKLQREEVLNERLQKIISGDILQWQRM